MPRSNHLQPYLCLFVSDPSYPANVSVKLGLGYGLNYLWHDGLSIRVLDIAERHLCAFVFVELEFRKVNVIDLIEGN